MLDYIARLHRFSAAAACCAADLFTPAHCVFCGRSEALSQIASVDVRFCDGCLASLPEISQPCRGCSAPLPLGVPLELPCSRCQQRRYRFASVLAGGGYEGRLRHLVLELKHGRRREIGAAFGEWLAARWLSEERSPAERTAVRLAAADYDFVAPLPSHWRRRWARGCNPPEEIARPFARILGIRLRERILRLVRRPEKQGTLTPNQRFENVRGLFRVSKGYDLAGRSALLVDDVLTTGATASEAARTLRRAGVVRVDVVVAARGVGG